MTCLKYLSTCPCPRCLLENSKIHRIGSKSDTRDRLKLIRVDSESRRNAVDAARRLIFEKGIDVASDRLKYFLEGESLTPTRVCLKFLVPFFSLILFRMPFRNGYIVMVSTSIKCSRLISSMSLNSVFGKPLLHIFFESYFLTEMEKFKNLTNGMILWVICNYDLPTLFSAIVKFPRLVGMPSENFQIMSLV